MLNHLLAALNDCVWAFDVNTQKYLFISPSIHAISNHTVKEFQQNTQLWDKIIDPRDHGEVLAKSDKNDNSDWSELTYRIISKGGKIKWVNQKKRQIIDEATGHDVILSVIKDASDQKQINAAMKESLGDFSMLFDDSESPMWIYELPTLRILKINNAAIKHYGYSEQEWMGMTIRDIRPRFDIAKFNEYMYRHAIPESSLTGFNHSGVWKHVNKKDEIIYADITGHEIKYGDSSCRVIIAADVTDRIKTEEALIEQNERLKNIASLSSHELRRPVASMIGLLNIIDHENFSNPENQQIIKHLTTVSHEIDEVIRLIVNKTFIDIPSSIS